MARCPGCNHPLDARAQNCAECNAVFGGNAAWQPLADTPAEAAQLQQLYPGRDLVDRTPRDVRKLKLAMMVVAGSGVVMHFGLAAASGGGGDFARSPGQAVFGIALALMWFSMPYVALLGGQLSLKSAGALSSLLVMGIGVIVLDVVLYAASNTKDWMVLFLPPFLLVVSAVCYLVALAVDKTQDRP